MTVRVVSLVPSSTETLLALGADVVACTKFCEQPELLHVGGTKNPDIAAIVALGPDLVVLDREENRIDDHDALVAAGLQVFVSDVRTVEAGSAVVGELARVVGVAAPASPPLGSIDPLATATAFVPIWRRPWMSISAATYGGALLRRLGIELVTADAEVGYPTLELEDVARSAPDLVLVPSEPYEFDGAHLDELAAALPSAEMHRIDGQDLFWWGVRTPEALARLGVALGRS
jgi:ABC-type Fe3+-hydroxamate transport system substrate-binding protein